MAEHKLPGTKAFPVRYLIDGFMVAKTKEGTYLVKRRGAPPSDRVEVASLKDARAYVAEQVGVSA